MRLLFLLFSFLFIVDLQSQNNPAFRLKKADEVAWIGGAALGLGLNQWVIQPRNKALTPSQIDALKTSDIPAFDRISTCQYNQKAKKASDILLIGAPFLASSLLLNKNIREHWLTEETILVESILCSASLVGITKNLVRRTRPLCYNPLVPMSEKTKQDARQSFYSGHSAATAATCIAAASLWSQNNPDSKWKPVVWTSAVAIPVTVAVLRIKAGKHFPSDVLTGLLIGGVSGWLIPKWHRVAG